MATATDIVGKRFGRLVVLARAENSKGRQAQWLCRCDCGKSKVIQGTSLRTDHTASCGCYHREMLRLRLTKHGHKSATGATGIYRSWLHILERCQDPHGKNAKYYYQRGITASPTWDKFENFLADMGASWFPHATIHWKENDKGYSKDNCEWLTRSEHSKLHHRMRKERITGTDLPLRPSQH